ncbi:MAG: phage holin family protein [Patescibacteria group bacterium]|nr:phage holin family protein [Patescibacteria group bacterium]
MTFAQISDKISRMWGFLLQIIAGILGIWISTKIVPGVEFKGEIQYLILAGVILGLINFFIKPIIKIIALPLTILTFGLFSLVINMGIIWVVDIIFPELIISGIIPLFWTSIIVWGLGWFLPKWLPEKEIS